MKHGRIVVVGSSNTDMVVRSAHLPSPGETVLGGDFMMNPGGKGANQAVSAARLGGQVCFVARVGDDLFGRQAISGFQDDGIDVSHITVDEHLPSGVALIMVDEKGENVISVALGANAAMNDHDIDSARSKIQEAAFLLVQLEVPLKAVSHAVRLARDSATQVILNPAPAQKLSDQLLGNIDILTPNETEAELLTGVEVVDRDSAKVAAAGLREKGVGSVIITMGSRGAYLLSDDYEGLRSGPQVNAIDTTAAGDTFNGALAVSLSEGMHLTDAVDFANRAAAFSVTKKGAQSSAPTRDDITQIK